MLLNLEQVEEAEAFLINHKDELSLLEWRSATDACRQAIYYFLDGSYPENYDIAFYCEIIGRTIWSFVEPDPNSDWYLHPDDFPAFYERQLFN